MGGRLPDIVLQVPKDAAHQAYIGVAGRDDFRIPDVKARLLIIEIFSMY